MMITSVAVAIVGWAAENAYFAGIFQPAQHAVVGNVAEKQESSIAKPHRAFCPTRACVQALNGSVEYDVFSKAWIDDLDGGVRIGSRSIGLPLFGTLPGIQG